MEKLNKLEKEILKKLSKKYPFLKKHIPKIRVKNREYTGVGIYINFEYLGEIAKLPKLEVLNASLSTNESIQIPGLTYGLAYELNVLDGLIGFIELVTYGEDWDGSISDFFFKTL